MEVQDLDSQTPKHQRLAKMLRQAIIRGELRAGQSLDTEAQLCERFGISRGPVRQALAALEREGLIHRTRGKGTFVTDRPFQADRRVLRIEVLIDYSGSLDENSLVIELIDELGRCAGSLQPQCRLTYRFHRFTDELSDDVRHSFTDPHCDGMLVVPFTRACIEYLGQMGTPQVPMVTFFNRIDAPSATHPQCFIDHEQAAFQATELLLRYGHRRIGLLLSSTVSPGPATTERLAGYQRALAAASEAAASEVASAADLVVEITQPEARSQPDIQRLLELSEPPTAMIVGGSRLIRPALRMLSAHKLRIPEDISVIAIDETPDALHHLPPITTVRQPIAQGGRQALEMLVHAITGTGADDASSSANAGSAPRVALRPELILRESCRPR